eukprot:GEMP01014930.1.p1 GENE.GEMP01014930.1~~GEMP01014930.1.p1  ORF type:complete len:389 (-),score=47.57 GEMP01014930.1:573-1739(-)
MAGVIVFAISIFRHGDRTFLNKVGWKSDNEEPLIKIIDENGGHGRLTMKGRAQHETVGSSMYERYVKPAEFLGVLDTPLHPQQIHVRSTDVDRTMQSAHAQLRKLFGAHRPIPIHTVTRDQVWNVLSGNRRVADTSCPALKWESAKWDRTLNNGKKVNVNEAVDSIFVCQPEAHNCLRSLSWTQAEVDQIKTWQKEINKELWSSSRSKLDAAPLASQIVRTLSNVTRGDKLWINDPTFFDKSLPRENPLVQDPLLMLYSAHESTLKFMLGALGEYDGSEPPYASQLVFELYYANAADKANQAIQPCVRLWYNKDIKNPWTNPIELSQPTKPCYSIKDLEDKLTTETVMMSVDAFKKACAKVPNSSPKSSAAAPFHLLAFLFLLIGGLW